LYDFYWVWSVIAFFTVDIILNFYTGFQYRGIMVSSLQISGMRYLTSVWIWVDVISTVPWDKMLVVDEKTEFARLLRIARIGKLMRLARLAKLRTIVPRVEAKLKDLGNHTAVVTFKMGKFLIVLMVLAHIIACCWGALGDMQWEGQDYPWIPDRELDYPWMQTVEGKGGVLLADLGWWQRYIFSFSWSTSVLLQSAYVPPYNPGTWPEVAFLIFANVFAFYVCALFVGSMVAMLDEMYTVKQKLAADKSQLEGFMVKRKIPSLLQARALDDLARSHETQLVPDDYEKVLTKLDPAIRQKIREELYVTIVARHPFFAQISPEALRYLCGTVHVIHTQRGEYVVRRGDVANSMFFVVEGQFLAQRPADDPRQEDAHLAHQSFFGAQCIFRESVRTRNVIATTNGELLEISTSAIYAVGEPFPDVKEMLRIRLKECADCDECCAHCGFAHKVKNCPELEHLKSSEDKIAERQKNKPVIAKKKPRLSFKDAVKVVVAGNKSKDSPSISPAFRLRSSAKALTEKNAADRMKARSATSKGAELLNGRGGNKRAWPKKDQLMNLSITPTSQPQTPTPASDETVTVLPPRGATAPGATAPGADIPSFATSTTMMSSDDDECPHSPLIDQPSVMSSSPLIDQASK
jgi:hypothetical protein